MAPRLIAALAIGGTLAAGAGSDFQEGVRHYAAEDYREAQAAFEVALEEAPDSSSNNLWLGLAIGRRLQTMSAIRRLGALPLARRVKRQFERAVELDGENLEALDALLGFHLEAPPMVGGSKARARELAELIRREDPVLGAVASAECHEAAGEFGNAAGELARARELAPDDIGPVLAQAAFLARRGDDTASGELFELAFRLDGDNPSVWITAARAWSEADSREFVEKAAGLAKRYLQTPKPDANAEPYFEVRALLRKLQRAL